MGTWCEVRNFASQKFRLTPAVALQTKFSLFIKFSRNLGRKAKASTHVLSTSKKHTTRFLVKSFGRCCGSTVLTVALLLAVKSLYSCSEVCVRVDGFSGFWTPIRVCAVTTPLHIQYQGWPNFLIRGPNSRLPGHWRAECSAIYVIYAA